MAEITLTPADETLIGWALNTPVPGDTPAEKLENFMAAMALYLPEEELIWIRSAMAEEFGVDLGGQEGP